MTPIQSLKRQPELVEGGQALAPRRRDAGDPRKKQGEQDALRALSSESKSRWGLPKRALRDLLLQPADI